MSENKQCPDIEELSAWADNESKEDYSKHVESCEVCREIVEDFRKMDNVMSGLFNAPQASEDLPGRVMEEVKKPQPIAFDWKRNLVKIAAILIAALVLSNFYKNKNSNDTVVKTPELPTNKETVVSAKNSNITEAIVNGNDPVTIPKGFEVVGTDPVEIEVGTEIIKDEVKHTWISADIDETVDLLKRLAFDAVVLKEDTLENKTELIISITDKQLVQVVNGLSNEGNNLISRALPQPGLSNITTLGNLVRYEVKILQKK